MNPYTPPGFLEFVSTMMAALAVFNTLCLVAVVIWWRIADEQLFRSKADYWLFTPEARRRKLIELRSNYFYFEALPLFVERSPLRQCMHRTRAPSLAPVLLVAVIQALPVVSLFIGVWYAIHLVWHVGVFALAQLKAHTPAPARRLLFTQWF